ncbi:radical SAM protein [Streptomyces sp. NPDC003032]
MSHPVRPHATLDPAAHRPVPFRQFVLKVHGRCNLDCSYCYVYRSPDASWRERPARADTTVMRRTAARVAEHVTRHRLPRIRIEPHGGEPLLTGPDAAIAYAREVRDAVPADCRVTATVQTNGTLLTGGARARTPESSAPSTSPPTRSTCTSHCSSWARPASTSCCRTAIGPPRG